LGSFCNFNVSRRHRFLPDPGQPFCP
jgi:hypothetical protein